jgi:hypothetical protein
MTTPVDLLTAARAEALFTSHLATASCPTRGDVTVTIRHAIRLHGGSRGCATVLAGEYGEHPDTAVSRMRWALGVVHAVYPKRPHAAPISHLWLCPCPSRPTAKQDRHDDPTTALRGESKLTSPIKSRWA